MAEAIGHSSTPGARPQAARRFLFRPLVHRPALDTWRASLGEGRPGFEARVALVVLGATSRTQSRTCALLSGPNPDRNP